jgi:hypothetical protein
MPIDDDSARRLLEIAGSTRVRLYRRRVHDGELQAIISYDLDGWHLSISHRGHSERRAKRYPTWDELAHGRYVLMPEGLDMVMHLPPASDYVALHDTTFHLHETMPQ